MSVIKADEKYQLVHHFIGGDGKKYCISMTVRPETDIEEADIYKLFLPKGNRDEKTKI